MAAREAATSDVAGLNSFTDKMLQGRAAAVMGDTADQHPAYKTSLKEASPQYAGLAERAYADGQQRSAMPPPPRQSRSMAVAERVS